MIISWWKMKINMYDFDDTIYNGDSTIDFIKYCYKHKYIKFKDIIKIIGAFIKYFFGIIDITQFKEVLFSFLNNVNDGERVVSEFWAEHYKNIKKFYLDKNHDNDIINSASPYFLLKPVCDKLGVKDLIASDVDLKTGKFREKNNSREVKVDNYNKKYINYILDECYSDNPFNDKFILELANKAYVVKGENLIDYKEYKPSFIKSLFRKLWGFYRNHLEVINYLFIGGCTTIVSILSYALFAKVCYLDLVVSNVLSWIIAVLFAYFTNRVIVFNSKNKNYIKEFISFTGSRVITLILDTLLMILFVKSLNMNDMIAKVIVQIVVIIGNYLISKLFVFKK